MDANRPKAEPGWPPVIVAGAYITGIVLMRALHRRGVRTFCVDCHANRPGFHTVYGKGYLCPNPDEKPHEWVRFMIGLVKEIGVQPVIIPSSDQFVTAIADHAEELGNYFIFCRSSVALQGLLATKKRQYDVAGTHGLPVPRTQFVSSLEEVREFGASNRPPYILKPLHFREWKVLERTHPLFEKKLVVADSRQILEESYQLASRINPEMVVQEMIMGPDTAKLVYLSCYDQKGKRIASCMVRQVRTDPIYFGSASVVEPVSDPEADRLCDEFLRNIGYAGLCEIELKRDSRDGQVKMIEANPRYSVTADAAPYAGVDLGWVHYLDLIGQPVEEVRPESRDFRHIVLQRDLATIGSYRREGLLSWGGLIRSYRPPVHFFDFDWRDWRVTASNLVLFARLLLRGPVRRIFPKKTA